jgi:hypothetical protein
MEDLMAMDVSGKDGGEPGREIAEPDHICSGPERVAGRPHGGSLDAVVHTKQADVRNLIPPTRSLEEVRKALPNVPPLVGEAGDCYTDSTDAHPECRRFSEHMKILVPSQMLVWDAGSLVVPGDKEDRDARIGNLEQGLKRLVYQGRGCTRTVKEVPSMDDEIRASLQRRPEGPFMIGLKVMTPPSPPDPGPQW